MEDGIERSIVNYYYEPHKCINILIKKKIKSIKGNHENILFETLDNNKKKNYVFEF